MRVGLAAAPLTFGLYCGMQGFGNASEFRRLLFSSQAKKEMHAVKNNLYYGL
jgi:hypothetical protein